MTSIPLAGQKRFAFNVGDVIGLEGYDRGTVIF
jgi:hypothetical protein